MSKELNIIEAIDMPIGTEFNVIFNDGCEAKVILEKTNKGNGKYFEWIKPPINEFDGETRDSVIAASGFINAKFIPLQKPVSFMEAVKSNKRICVDYQPIANWLNRVIYEKYKNFMSLTGLFYEFASDFSREHQTEIIVNGKWYIED